MAIDSRFIVTSDLESYFVDKDSGEPLAGGIVTFYSDINRSTKKPVYQLTGSPPNYTYAALPNPCVLSDVGTFQDALGNNIVPYYFPYEGTPDDDNTTVELYYITVESSGFVPQFIREGWPNFSNEGSTTASDDRNFIPNGQFLAHTDIVGTSEPPVETIAFGSVNLASQAIAQGGWFFRHTDGGTSVFDNSFERISTSVAGLNDFPRYAFNFKCTSFNATDSVRDLTIEWPNVNTFSGGDPVGTQDYTFYFSAMSNDGNTYVFDIYLIQYFGTGGSPSSPIQTLLSSVSISPGYSSYTFHIAGFPANAGTLGTNDDDYVALAIRGPASSWDAQFTDFALLFGNVSLTSFPVQTNAEQLSEGVAGWMPTPNPDGSDMYLPLVLTPSGMTFDASQIGQIVGDITDTPTGNHLYCDGTMYVTDDYSSLGIPYSRLQQKLFISGPNVPKFGTGMEFLNVHIPAALTSTLILTQNNGTLNTNPSDGTTATGFTFNNSAPNINAGSGGFSYSYSQSNSSGIVNLIGNFTGGTNGGNVFQPGTSGIVTYANYDQGHASSIFGAYFLSRTAAQFGNGGGAGKYFTISDQATNYYVWFFTSAETDPAPGGTGVRVNLSASMDAVDTANIIASVVAGRQTNSITVTSAATIPAGSWFRFNTHVNLDFYVVWYKVGGSGSEPVVAGATDYIQVTLTGTETAAQVATATQIAINSYSFAVPNLLGMFLRGTDVSSGQPQWDLDQNNRWTFPNYVDPKLSGTFEFFETMAHNHAMNPVQIGDVNVGGGALNYLSPTGTNATSTTLKNYASGSTGLVSGTDATETRPVNMSVRWYIKY